jgi:folate-binding protein YgfZ
MSAVEITNTTFDYPALQQKTVISVLDNDCSGYGVLEIAGIDSAKFLQGQLTCNVQEITAQQSRLGAHCTHKGRMVANFRLLQYAEQHYLFVLPKDTLPALQKSLSKYIVFSKAKLRDVSDEYTLLGISGTHAEHSAKEHFGIDANTVDTQQHHQHGVVICVNTNPARYLLITAKTNSDIVNTLVSQAEATTDAHYWHWLDIRDGIGNVRAETIEEFIPQMLNLQSLNGISFTKGCYTGQEIVARMQYRGILKKAMYRIAGSGNVPVPNTAIFQHGETQAVGHIVNAENINATQWEALAVINHEAIEQVLHLQDSEEVLTVLPLPYTL